MNYKPTLIVIAGPNGSGKTSVTHQILKHEWVEGCIYINPDNIAQQTFGNWNAPEGGHDVPIAKIISRYSKSISNCCSISTFVDRLYVYDNSEDYAPAKLLFRTVTGKVHKIYEQVNPWALPILKCVIN